MSIALFGLAILFLKHQAENPMYSGDGVKLGIYILIATLFNGSITLFKSCMSD